MVLVVLFKKINMWIKKQTFIILYFVFMIKKPDFWKSLSKN